MSNSKLTDSNRSPYIAWFADMVANVYGALFLVILFNISNVEKQQIPISENFNGLTSDQIFIAVGILTSCSRLGWRMAEDKAFPYSEWLATIHPKLKVPFNIMLVFFALEIAVGTTASILRRVRSFC